MPLSPPAPREHLHTRTVTCRGYRREDGLWDIEGHLVDVKSYDFDNHHRGEVKAGEPVHEMWLRLSIDDDMHIKAAEAATDHAPYAMCPDITPRFALLEGLRIGPGFHREVQKRVGGVRGCRDVDLVRAVGVVQDHAEHEPILLRLGQRIRALLFNGVLRRDHAERRGQR